MSISLLKFVFFAYFLYWSHVTVLGLHELHVDADGNSIVIAGREVIGVFPNEIPPGCRSIALNITFLAIKCNINGIN
jgi:hypothetical protein